MQAKSTSSVQEYSHIFSMPYDTIKFNDSILPDFIGCGLAGEKLPYEVIKTIDLSANKHQIARSKEGLNR